MVKPTNRRHFGTAESIGLSTACGIALCSHDAHPQYERDRCVTGIAGLDEILRGGILTVQQCWSQELAVQERQPCAWNSW